ncbi:MAG: amidohydrolase family protein [Ruminococcus sp.]|nr:amidohydrolase family protein [Ruminococcus sp.]
MIIDFHTHAFNPKIAERAMTRLEEMSGLEPYTHGLVEQLVNRMDEWGVDRSVMLSIATKPTQQAVINDWAAEIDSENERIIAFGSVHPKADDFVQELIRIKELGLHGVKLHPDFQQFMVEDPSLDELYDTITQLDLPLVLHAGLDYASPELLHCTPQGVANVLKRHPSMKVVLAHLGGNARWNEVYDLLAGVDGEVYFDTSFTSACPDELMEKIIYKHGVDRILLGSDCPWESAQKMIEKLLRLNISDDDRDKIFGINALRLLGMKS